MAERTHLVGKDAADFGMAMALLVKYYNMPDEYMDTHRVRIYEHGLRKVPGPLVIAAAMRATKTRTWFPKVNELLLDAEACRRALLDAHPYDGCVDCEDHKGWIETTVDGVKRMAICPCKRRWFLKLESLGVTQERLALPAGVDSHPPEKVSA